MRMGRRAASAAGRGRRHVGGAVLRPLGGGGLAVRDEEGELHKNGSALQEGISERYGAIHPSPYRPPPQLSSVSSQVDDGAGDRAGMSVPSLEESDGTGKHPKRSSPADIRRMATREVAPAASRPLQSSSRDLTRSHSSESNTRPSGDLAPRRLSRHSTGSSDGATAARRAISSQRGLPPLRAHNNVAPSPSHSGSHPAHERPQQPVLQRAGAHSAGAPTAPERRPPARRHLGERRGGRGRGTRGARIVREVNP